MSVKKRFYLSRTQQKLVQNIGQWIGHIYSLHLCKHLKVLEAVFSTIDDVVLPISWKKGGAEIARPDIARTDSAAPYRKGGHRETCFSVPVDAHYKFMFDSGSIIWAAHRFYHVSSSFCFTYCYVRQTKLASSLDTVWAHYNSDWLCDWLIDQFLKVFFVITASSCILSTLHGTSAKPACTWRHDAHTSQQSSEVVAAAAVADSDAPGMQLAPCLFSCSSSMLLLLLLLSTFGCRDCVWVPFWLTARRNCMATIGL